jgi:hypothetical protein
LNWSATRQGDKIGRVFADWAIVYFGLLFENYKSRPNYWATFFHGETCEKTGWATVWAISSQTHLVTLSTPHIYFSSMDSFETEYFRSMDFFLQPPIFNDENGLILKG